ncbi:MAG: 1-acyl-sn-glycerol-3-phosphate acyltransferase [Deltaproteobacteria bacterium]|nr:1-acyl-sn-glycerol-3-phosphate acyltransferase [Deltaproteobacteria bacterium]
MSENVGENESDMHPGLAPVTPFGVLRIIWTACWGFLATMVVSWIPTFTIAVLLIPFKKNRDFADWWIYWLMSSFQGLFGIEIDIEGLHNIDPKKTYIIVVNHRSWADAIALVVCLHNVLPFSTIIKRGLTYIPLAGWFLLLAGYVPVDRGQKKKGANEPLASASETLKSGRSMLVFPEGTRSPSHRFTRLKKGAAILSRDHQLEMLPITISGAQFLFPKGTFVVRPGKIHVEFGAPLPPPAKETVDLRDTQEAIFKALAEPYRLKADGPRARDIEGMVERLRPRV